MPIINPVKINIAAATAMLAVNDCAIEFCHGFSCHPNTLVSGSAVLAPNPPTKHSPIQILNLGKSATWLVPSGARIAKTDPAMRQVITIGIRAGMIALESFDIFP